MSGFFVVRFGPGPRWVEGRSVFDQPLDGHLAYLKRLYAEGKVLMGGPLCDGSGGMTIFHAATEQEAADLVAGDPAVAGKILSPLLQGWAPIAWSHLSKTAVLYEVAPLTVSRRHPPRPRGRSPRAGPGRERA